MNCIHYTISYKSPLFATAREFCLIVIYINKGYFYMHGSPCRPKVTFSFQNLTQSIDKILHIQGGSLVERRLNQRKWKWVVHGSPKGQHLTSITPVLQDELNDKLFSLFLTTSSGSIYECQIPKQSGESSRHYEETNCLISVNYIPLEAVSQFEFYRNKHLTF